MEYLDFLKKKNHYDYNNGFEIHKNKLHKSLFPFQKDCTKWAVRKGKAALFLDAGLGKTRCQIEWLRVILEEKGGNGLILCPLSVAEQSINEGKDIGVSIKYIKSDSEIDGTGIYISNYERLENLGGNYSAVVLDESSILKSIGGKTKNRIFEQFAGIKFKLSCSATPSPNDIAELANQVQFLDIMKREEMLARFFVHDESEWRLKGHAEKEFFKWVASWAIFLRKPSDLEHDDTGYDLPPLNIDHEIVLSEYVPEGELFAITTLNGLQGRIDERKKTIDAKVERITEIVNASKEQWIIWCGLNDESKACRKLMTDSVEVKGDDSIEFKNKALWDFKKGKIKVLITKAKISGYGMNFQNCHNQAFIGLGDSFEAYYQCIRRSWRFGQKKPVNIKIAITNAEQDIVKNVKRKESDNAILMEHVIREMKIDMIQEIKEGAVHYMDEYKKNYAESENWKLWQGDTVETIKELSDNSIDLSIFSPPFASLYTYSPSDRDLGNSKNEDDFWVHFDFIIPELLRIIKEGRLCAVHVMNFPAMLVRDGYIGVKDFRGDMIRGFQKHGWIFHGEVCIGKNPQAQSIRTHSKGLTFSQLERDSSWLRPALADYLLIFRKPGENKVIVENGDDRGEVTRDEWIKLAYPIWTDINETRTLNAREGRNEKDNKHICPLQLDVIHNAVLLWSNRGETIYSPFAGVGSEGFQAILDGRKFIGCELKEDYWKTACKNLKEAERKKVEKEFGLFKEVI